MQPVHPLQTFAKSQTLYPGRDKLWKRFAVLAQVLGMFAAVVMHGLQNVGHTVQLELGLLIFLTMAILSLGLGLRFRWSLIRKTFLRTNRVAIGIVFLWLGGLFLILIFAPLFPKVAGEDVTRVTSSIFLSEICILLQVFVSVVGMVRSATAGGTNPALVLVLSFLIMITIGTALLSLPKARNPDFHSETNRDPFLTSLFTSTSATCVTGLVVEPTGEYWSRFGQTVILVLFQIGGLGIMTFGAFFAVFSGRGMPIRETVTMQNLLESDRLGDVRRLILAVLIFTFTAEFLGVVLISGMWESENDRWFNSVFHSVSAYCNAGFSLTKNSFVGEGHRWQVWGVMTALIIIGGLGFSVLYNLAVVLKSRFSSIELQPLFHLPKKRPRLTISSRLILITTIVLLIGGAFGYDLLENKAHAQNGASSSERIQEAWFQSVTFRTAGFNTVDHGKLQPATKLFAVMLMFIGASPGSTGGGIKTICFALTVLALVSILKGRKSVEIFGRKIPDELVHRAMAILFLGMMMVLFTTLLLVMFEKSADRFLDLLFEATSAFATVGVSTGITSELSVPSQIVVIATMFIGRVGPLTLLIALAGRTAEARYEYPTERVLLG